MPSEEHAATHYGDKPLSADSKLGVGQGHPEDPLALGIWVNMRDYEVVVDGSRMYVDPWFKDLPVPLSLSGETSLGFYFSALLLAMPIYPRETMLSPITAVFVSTQSALYTLVVGFVGPR